MSKSTLSILTFACGAASLAIAAYQFIDSRPLDGALSVVFAAVFLGLGVAGRRRAD